MRNLQCVIMGNEFLTESTETKRRGTEKIIKIFCVLCILIFLCVRFVINAFINQSL